MTEKVVPKGQIDLIAFSWRHDPAGYEIVKTKKGPRGWTPETLWEPGTEILKGMSGTLTDYTPNPADPVHRRFAMLGDDPCALIGFAHEYGLPTRDTGPEAITDMLTARDQVRKVIAAVDKANTAQGAAAIKHMGVVAMLWGEMGSRPGVGRVLGEPRPRLNMSFVPRLEKGVTATVVLKAVPSTLLDYMLLLAAFELQGQAAWRECSVCGQWMPLGPGKGRSHRDTCSNACRQAKYQRKKDAALRSKGGRKQRSQRKKG